MPLVQSYVDREKVLGAAEAPRSEIERGAPARLGRDPPRHHVAVAAARLPVRDVVADHRIRRDEKIPGHENVLPFAGTSVVVGDLDPHLGGRERIVRVDREFSGDHSLLYRVGDELDVLARAVGGVHVPIELTEVSGLEVGLPDHRCTRHAGFAEHTGEHEQASPCAKICR